MIRVAGKTNNHKQRVQFIRIRIISHKVVSLNPTIDDVKTLLVWVICKYCMRASLEAYPAPAKTGYPTHLNFSTSPKKSNKQITMVHFALTELFKTHIQQKQTVTATNTRPAIKPRNHW